MRIYLWLLFWTGQKTNRTLTRGIWHPALRLRTQRSTPVCLHPATQEHASLQGSRYTWSLTTLITCRVSQRRLCSRRAYIRVNLLHPQDTHHFSQHFLHFLSQFHYWLERWSANVPAGTFRSTAKTHRHRTQNRYTVPKTVTDSPEHSLPPLWLNRSHRTDQLLHMPMYFFLAKLAYNSIIMTTEISTMFTYQHATIICSMPRIPLTNKRVKSHFGRRMCEVVSL